MSIAPHVLQYNSLWRFQGVIPLTSLYPLFRYVPFRYYGFWLWLNGMSDETKTEGGRTLGNARLACGSKLKRSRPCARVSATIDPMRQDDQSRRRFPFPCIISFLSSLISSFSLSFRRHNEVSEREIHSTLRECRAKSNTVCCRRCKRKCVSRFITFVCVSFSHSKPVCVAFSENDSAPSVPLSKYTTPNRVCRASWYIFAREGIR